MSPTLTQHGLGALRARVSAGPGLGILTRGVLGVGKGDLSTQGPPGWGGPRSGPGGKSGSGVRLKRTCPRGSSPGTCPTRRGPGHSSPSSRQWVGWRKGPGQPVEGQPCSLEVAVMMLRCLSARPGNPAPLPVLSYAKLTPPCPTWGCEGTQHIQAQSPQGEPGMGGVSWEMITPQGSTPGL